MADNNGQPAGKVNNKVLVIPSQCETIGRNAFNACCWFSQVVDGAPEGSQDRLTIEKNAFNQAIYLETVQFNRPTDVGDGAFAYLRRLQEGKFAPGSTFGEALFAWTRGNYCVEFNDPLTQEQFAAITRGASESAIFMVPPPKPTQNSGPTAHDQ